MTRLVKLWLNSNDFELESEIRLDWDNDRHHAVVINRPLDREQVARSLVKMADLIMYDTKLLD